MSGAKRSGVSRRSALLWIPSRPKRTASLRFRAPRNWFPTMSERRQPNPVELLSPWRTEQRLALQAEARAFARDVVLPIADELDRKKGEMPRSLIDEMGARGWFGITIPAESGGLGLGVFEYCLVSEELARAWLSVGSILTAQPAFRMA